MKHRYTVLSYILLVGMLFLLGAMAEQVAAAKMHQCPDSAAHSAPAQGSSAGSAIEITHDGGQAETSPVFTSNLLTGGNQ
jgi:hypothetical protein